jgi:hypothetical protein
MPYTSKATLYERHLQSAMLALLSAVSIWGGTTLLEVSQHMAASTEKVSALVETVKGIDSRLMVLEQRVALASEDRYRGRDADRDRQVIASALALRDKMIDAVEADLDRLEARVRQIEDGHE